MTAAPIADYIGRRNALIIALAISLAGVTLECVATTNPVFFGGKLMSGTAVAAMESICGTYLAEARSLPCILGHGFLINQTDCPVGSSWLHDGSDTVCSFGGLFDHRPHSQLDWNIHESMGLQGRIL